METTSFPELRRNYIKTLQVNIGYRCNQRCSHCHVDAGPDRNEMMSKNTLLQVIEVLKLYKINILDITGGAPELHPQFKELVLKANSIGIEVIDRCNLTILNEPGHESLANFLAENKVTVVASMPCYEKLNVDKQRGKGVFDRSILGLQLLNKLGYGKGDQKLTLNLVFNPQGAHLPPPQIELESDYKRYLHKYYNITFDHLYTITNMPINRFALSLSNSGKLKEYQKLLRKKFNPINLENVMCKNLISVDWQGFLYDCDFNQQIGLHPRSKAKHLEDLIKYKYILEGDNIQTGEHCYGCTAGSGSSCSGALKNY